MKRITRLATLVLCVAFPTTTRSQQLALTFEEAIERAQASAPAIAVARMRIDEARARLRGASLLLPTNPSVELEAGRRRGDASTREFGVEVTQDFELPKRRRARIDASRSAVVVEQERAREVETETLRAVATAFLRAVEARERAAAASGSVEIAAETLSIAQRRYESGDVALLDVNLAKTAIARATAEARFEMASAAAQTAGLQMLLGLSEPITVQGTLEAAAPVAIDDVARRVGERPELRALDAEIAVVEAESRLARTLRWPEFGLRGAYNEEEGDRIATGGVGFTLPVFNRGQEEIAVAEARLARLRLERDALARTAEAELRRAVAAYEALRAASSEYQRTVAPLVEENERLALESYDVGQIGLADLLLVRRESLDARRALIDQLIEARLAEVELRGLAGVWK